MLKHLHLEVEDPSSISPLWVFLDMSVVTLLLPAIGLWRHPADPFFLHGGFPWLALAPLLVGLRYGFARGLASAAVLNLLMYVCYRLGRPGMLHFPGSLALGLLLVGMLAGEFCDMWIRRLHRFSELSQYRHTLLQKFTRSYHLLALSHERLERRVLTNTKSLREAMTYLRERALALEPDSPDSRELHQLMMEALSSFGLIQVASLYRVDAYGILIPNIVAKIGNPKPVRLNDPLLEQALKQKQLTCIRPEQSTAQAQDPSGAPIAESLLLALPLVDVHGRLWGIVTVQQLPFMALSQDHLNLLAILAGHFGDLLALSFGGALYQFHGCLLRCQLDAQKHNLSAMLCALVVDTNVAPSTLVTNLLDVHRGLDQQWLTKNRHGQRVLFMILPLTDAEGARGFVQRLENFCQDRYSRPLCELGVRVHQRLVEGTTDAIATLDTLKEACEIDVAKT